jgi:hypothetical protein
MLLAFWVDWKEEEKGLKKILVNLSQPNRGGKGLLGPRGGRTIR